MFINKKKLGKKVIIFLLIAILLTNIVGCSTNSTAQDTVEITDHLGRKVLVPKDVKRIVSAYYISTSLLIALGVEDRVVGLEILPDKRPLYKKAAPELIDLPTLGNGKTFNIEECIKLKPDLVIMPVRMKEYIDKLEKLNIPVLAVSPEDLNSLEDTISLVGKAVGAQERAQKLISFYQEKVAMVEKLTENIEAKPTVYLAGKKSPLTTCTQEMYQHYLINLAGGRNVSEEIEKGYWANVSQEQIITWNPEVLLVVQYAAYEQKELWDDQKWNSVKAIKNKQVYTFPSAIEPWDYPMPSAVLGILWLTNKLHPEVYGEETLAQDIKYFYKEFYGVDISLEELKI